MRTNALILVAALALAAPIGSAGGTAACDPNTTTPTAEVAGFYVYGQEVWQESNGLPGLQRQYTPCTDGGIPKDTCFTHKENNALLACAITGPTNLVIA